MIAALLAALNFWPLLFEGWKNQPRSQGFSLEGKSPGNEVVEKYTHRISRYPVG